ncbi:PQQ-binding-like beta-propeller repeat protein [Candidatus Riflebacteria bacterium]
MVKFGSIKKVSLCSLFLFLTGLCFAGNITQWRGEKRDGVYTESGLLKSWSAEGPELLQVFENCGAGYGSPVLNDGKIYLTGSDEENEFLSCFNAKGKLLFRTNFSKIWHGAFPNARCTPTYADGVLYIVSIQGKALAISAETGKLLWRVPVWEKYQGRWGTWGACESPLIYEGKMIVTPAGKLTTMMAFNVKNGKPVWRTISLRDKSAYVSPILIEHNGIKQIINVTSSYIFAVDPDKGKIVWKVNYKKISVENSGSPGAFGINTNTPIFHNGSIFVTSGYDHACVMLKLNEDATDTRVVWKSGVLDTHHGHVVLVDGYLYGSNWLSNQRGNWTCLNWQTGEKMWEKKWKNKGAIISADGMLYCYVEKGGYFGLVEATPKEFNLISSFKIKKGTGMHWSHPVISDGKLYVRHGTTLMLYDIKM